MCVLYIGRMYPDQPSVYTAICKYAEWISHLCNWKLSNSKIYFLENIVRCIRFFLLCYSCCLVIDTELTLDVSVKICASISAMISMLVLWSKTRSQDCLTNLLYKSRKSQFGQTEQWASNTRYASVLDVSKKLKSYNNI